MEWISNTRKEYDDWIYRQGKAYEADFSRSGLREVPLEKRTGQLLDLFADKDIVSGKEIILNMQLAEHGHMDPKTNTPAISEFFEFFCYQSRVLDINPGEEDMAELFISNHYGIKKEYKREIRLRRILNQ